MNHKNKFGLLYDPNRRESWSSVSLTLTRKIEAGQSDNEKARIFNSSVKTNSSAKNNKKMK